MAGVLAILPLEEASTVHDTIIAGTVGLACITDTANYGAVQVDGDDLVLAFPNKEIKILALRMQTDDGDDDFGFDEDIIANGGVIQTTLLGNTAIQDAQENVLNQLDPLGDGIVIGTGNNLTLQFDTNAPMDNGDVLTIEVCGLIQDPANFVDGDLTITAQNLNEPVEGFG